MTILLLALLYLARYCSATGDIDCGRVPSSLWCKNEELMAKCGVEAPCAKYEESSKSEKILLTVLYESLCPAGPLYNEIYANFGTKVVDIELVPYGNARRSDNGTITCQHGPEECRINAYEGCAIHFIQKPLPLIYCLEKKIMNGATLEKASKDCFEKLKLSHIAYDQVLHCASGKKGRDLQIEAAKRTESAWPAQHQHVPWLFFNNVSLSNSQFLIRDLTMSLCDWYVGDTPPVCAGIGHRTKYHMGNGCQKEF